jgi:hypothetical protein
VRFGIVKVYVEKDCRKIKFMYNIQSVAQKKRQTQIASRLNCQNIFFKYAHILFLVILIEIFSLKTIMYDMCNLIPGVHSQSRT